MVTEIPDAAHAAASSGPHESFEESESSGPPAAQSARDETNGRNLLALLDRWSSGFALVLLAVAFFFGAAHAMTPGHGKTMVAAYLVGERGTLRHAVGLGLATSLTHVGSVLAVAVALYLFSPPLEQQIHSRFSLFSGMLVAGLGAWLLLVRLGRARVRRLHGGAREDHDECPRHSSRQPAPADSYDSPSWASLLTLGVSGGIVPCWEAVILLLIAAAQGELTRAFWLLLSFSAGLATALVAVGIVAVKFRGYLASRIGSGRIVQALPILSATMILVVGVYLCVSSLRSAEIVTGLATSALHRTGGR
jgi:ABC-type nickel/cobalt efflux system permease component RcnA